MKPRVPAAVVQKLILESTSFFVRENTTD
jgi:hypothetical protein